MRHTILMLTCAVALAACGGRPGGEPPAGPHVSVQGEAMVEVTPDQLEVRFSVTRTADDVATATRDVDRRTAAALEVLREAGVDGDDVRALSITVQPMWDWHDGERRLRGHEAVRAVRLKLRDVDAWSRIVSALVAAGVDRVDSVEPTHSDRQGIARDALRSALADARARAEALADAAGVALGGVHSITETGRNYTVPQRQQAMRLQAADESAEAYQPGTITITSNVQATFRLEPR